MGRRGTGKTDLALYFMEVIYKLGIIQHFITNIKIYDAPFRIDYTDNLDDLRSWCLNNTGRKLFLFDEAGKALRRRTPMSGLNVALLDDLQILRKYRLSIIFCVPHEKYMDNASLGSDVLDLVIFKPVFNNPKIALWVDQLEQNRISFQDIPRTEVKFDSYDVATFKRSGEKQIPRFKDEDKQFLYEVYKKIKINLTPQERKRKQRLTEKYMIESLEIGGDT